MLRGVSGLALNQALVMSALLSGGSVGVSPNLFLTKSESKAPPGTLPT